MKRLSTWLLVVAAAMMAAAVVFLILAKVTPWHTDSDAYFAERAAATEIGAQAFYKVLHRYETNKWLYADAGYGLAGWSLAFIAIWRLVKTHGWRALATTTSNAWRIVGLTCLACGLMWAGLMANGLQELHRDRVYDGSTGPMGAGILMLTPLWLVGTLIFLAFGLAPLWRRPARGQTLLPFKPVGRGLLVSLVYAPLLIVPGVLMIYAINLAPGGWGMSIGGVLSAWLILNARALWMSECVLDAGETPAAGEQAGSVGRTRRRRRVEPLDVRAALQSATALPSITSTSRATLMIWRIGARR